MFYEYAKETVVMSAYVLIVVIDIWVICKGLLWVLRKLWREITKKEDTD